MNDDFTIVKPFDSWNLRDEYILKKDAIFITAETGALETQSRIMKLKPKNVKEVIFAQAKEGENGSLFCTNCNEYLSPYFKYCPKCGADITHHVYEIPKEETNEN